MSVSSTPPLMALPLLLLSLVSSVLSQSQPFALDYRSLDDTRFCGTSCKNVAVLTNRPIFLSFYKQPYYEVMSSLTPDTSNIDNVCYTLTTLSHDSWILYISKVYSNGTNLVNAYVTTEETTRNYDGAWFTNSPNCTFSDYAFAEVSNIDLIYRCFHYGGCSQEGAGCGDYLFALTTSKEPVDPCTFRQAQEMFSRNGFSEQLIAYPLRLPTQCVTSQPCRNGISNTGGGCGCND